MGEGRLALENLDIVCADRASSMLQLLKTQWADEAAAEITAENTKRSVTGDKEKMSEDSSVASSKQEKSPEKLVTDALAVLEEQGVYALFLYLQSQKKHGGGKVCVGLIELLKASPRHQPLLAESTENDFSRIRTMARDLDKLLLAHDLLRRTLVYLLYHVRMLKKEQSAQ